MITENPPIDWTVVPDIKEDLDQFKYLRESDDSNISNVGQWLRPQTSQVLWLRVEVTDVDLAQVVLASMYDQNHGDQHSLIPGFNLTQATFKDPNTENLSQQLRVLADKLDRDNL